MQKRGFSYFVVVSFIVGVPGENHRPAASLSSLQTLSHNVISSTPGCVSIQT
jgi:hypothetical protein